MYTRILRGNKINMKGSPMAQLAKTPLAMQQTTCNARDTGSIPGSGIPLQKEMAAHSSILAWEIPWTEEPGGMQSMG